MAKLVFGVDVGGTTVKMGLFEESGEIREKWEIPTRCENNGASILPDIASAIEDAISRNGLTKEDIRGIGIGLPGPALSDGTVPFCVNLGWKEPVNIAEKMKALTGLETRVGNDANVAALGEAWKGAGCGAENLVMVTLGTGVGGGIILGGRILHGANGAGGEIGHINVNIHETIACNCGCKGCLEQYASATGIVRLTRERLAKDDLESPLRRLSEITAKDLFDCAKQKDALSLEVVERFARILGRALAGIADTVDPEMIVIGGGVSKAGEIITEYVGKYYQQFAFSAVKKTPIKLATLGNDAGIYGCAKMLIEE